MKRLLVVFVLIAGIAAVAFASLSSKQNKTRIEKKMEKPKKECKHSCIYS